MDSNCQTVGNFVFCNFSDIIHCGKDSLQLNHSALVNDVNDVIIIPAEVNFNDELKKVEVISTNAFGYSSITKAILPYTITTLKRDAFIFCTHLSEIYIPEHTKLTTIGQGALFGLKSMKRFWIPFAVTNISKHGLGRNSGMHIYYCGNINFTADIFEKESNSPIVHVSESFEGETIGQYHISDHSFNCYFPPYYRNTCGRPVTIHRNAVFISLIFSMF